MPSPCIYVYKFIRPYAQRRDLCKCKRPHVEWPGRRRECPIAPASGPADERARDNETRVGGQRRGLLSLRCVGAPARLRGITLSSPADGKKTSGSFGVGVNLHEDAFPAITDCKNESNLGFASYNVLHRLWQRVVVTAWAVGNQLASQRLSMHGPSFCRQRATF